MDDKYYDDYAEESYELGGGSLDGFNSKREWKKYFIETLKKMDFDDFFEMHFSGYEIENGVEKFIPIVKSIQVKLENWNEYKDMLFDKRTEFYNDSYTLKQKINLELDRLKELPTFDDNDKIFQDRYNDERVLADNYKEYLLTKKANLKSQSAKGAKQQKKTSYVWQSNPDKELPELYSLMTNKYSLIASETTLGQFTAIFIGQLIQSITPVKWHQDNATELLYFIHRLEQSGNIDYNPKRANYQRMTDCFVKPDGSKFEASWKQLKQNIDINLSDNKQRAIDELVNNF